MKMLVCVERKYRARDGGSQEGEANTTAHLSVVYFFCFVSLFHRFELSAAWCKKKALSNRKGRGVQ
jgi:hypothetical protein